MGRRTSQRAPPRRVGLSPCRVHLGTIRAATNMIVQALTVDARTAERQSTVVTCWACQNPADRRRSGLCDACRQARQGARANNSTLGHSVWRHRRRTEPVDAAPPESPPTRRPHRPYDDHPCRRPKRLA